MSATRSRIRKCLILTLFCELLILALHYSTKRYNIAIRDLMPGERENCTARLENTKQVLNLTSILESLNRTDEQIPYLKSGGRYKPSTCNAIHRVAVIVPYRDRETHLKIFMKYMHPLLQRKQLEYGIFVVESMPDVKFNRGLLLNIGYTEVKKNYDYDCLIFHDVDLLPESDVTDYTCENSPLHMASAIDVEKYRLPYKSFFGGVNAFKRDHFETINGFSNLYFDWGGEDDDIHERSNSKGLRITHLSPENGRYKMLKHVHAKPNPDKNLLWQTMRKRQHVDGLNSLKYHVIKREFNRLYTWILVSVNETQILDSEPIHKEAFTTTTILPTTKLPSETSSYTSKTQILQSEPIHKDTITTKLLTTTLPSKTNSYTSKTQILESEAVHKEALTTKLSNTKLSSVSRSLISQRNTSTKQI